MAVLHYAFTCSITLPDNGRANRPKRMVEIKRIYYILFRRVFQYIKNLIYLYNKTGYRYGNLLDSCYSICTLFFISCLFFQYLLYVTISPWSRTLINVLSITITKLTRAYIHTCIHKDANVYEYVQVTFHTLVPWISTNTITIWSLRLLRHHTVRIRFT